MRVTVREEERSLFGNEYGPLPSSGQTRKSNSVDVKKKIFKYFLNSFQQYLMNVYNVLVCHGMMGQTPRMPEIILPFEKLTDMTGK